MMRKTIALAALAVAGSALMTGCADAPVAPAPATAPKPSQYLTTGLSADGQLVTFAHRNTPLKRDTSVSGIIGPAGGNVHIAIAGVRLTVPGGAVTQNTRFTIRAFAGSDIYYEFEPHGVTFAKPLTIIQSLNGKYGVKESNQAPNFLGGYFPDLSYLDLENDVATVTETYPVIVVNGTVKFNVTHFSGYLLASGRAR